MLKRMPVDILLKMLDDFLLGITYRVKDKIGEALLQRAKAAAQAFDAELGKLGITANDRPLS